MNPFTFAWMMIVLLVLWSIDDNLEQIGNRLTEVSAKQGIGP